MKDKKRTNKSPAQLKSRLMAALAMLLVASVLMGSTTYAWLVLSIAPEVTGISTNIGANGSLEIALLNTETRQNMNNISSGKVGESLAAGRLSANNAWGNLVDLNDTSYGLDNIVLMPARLDLVANESGTGYTVSSGLLSIPTYGYDGRVIDVTADAVSTVYNENGEFAYVPAAQTYGVRAIGTSENLTEQASALAMAKSNITTYTNSAANAASGSLAKNGNSLVNDIIAGHILNPDSPYDDADLGILKAMIKDLDDAAYYIELALRQGIVAMVASVEGDEANFITYRDQIIDTSKPLSDLLEDMKKVISVPETFVEWVEELGNIENELALATNSCYALTGGVYTWAELSAALSVLMDLNYVYINDTLYPEFDKSQAGELMGGDNSITLAPGSGVFADIADFTGNFSTMVSTIMGNVTITTSTLQKPVRLTALYESVKNLEAAGDATGTQSVSLSNTYGYALDLAFRCSAEESELLLQTAGIQRVYEDSAALATQGGGSYMEFAVTESVANTILLLDAVRVAFVDDAGNLLGIGKLNTSNRQTSGSVIKAPLYLYDFSISEEDGSMVMGERKKTDNTITTLQRNIGKAVTVVVWLDGDMVDNSMVSGEAETSMSGMLNLQFASSADLIPARNTEFLNITVDRADLAAKVAEMAPTVEAGQLSYSSVSWNAFVAAYNRAAAVAEDNSAVGPQIMNASSELTEAKNALAIADHDALNDMIAEIREIMGKTDDLVSISLKNDAGEYEVVYEYTMEQYDNRIKNADVFHVDYSMNLRDEGNDLTSRIYTDESWNVLAGALYLAEQVSGNELATEEEINAVMTALDTAYDALVPGAYFFPYDYAGTLYYYAVPQNEGDDTYGKWYDNQFQRIISDKTILDLDAHAEPATIASIAISNYLPWDTVSIDPYVELLDHIYPTLADDEIIGFQMDREEMIFFDAVMNSTHTDSLNALIKTVTDEALNVDVSAAQTILDRKASTSAKEAESVIDNLVARVEEALAVKYPAEPVTEMMSADQYTVMTKAVSVAQSVISAYNPGVDEKGNPNPENPAITSLKNAKTAVETLLAATTEVTAEEANAALDALNIQLIANGKREVTIYNTIVHTIPTVDDVYEIAYTTEYPRFLSGETGQTGLYVVGVTKKGVVFTTMADVEIYTDATHVEIETRDYLWVPSEIMVGQTLDLSAWLEYGKRPLDELELMIELGNLRCDYTESENGDISYNYHVDEYGDIIYDIIGVAQSEDPYSYTWASSNTEVATVTTDTAVGTVEGLAEGTVTISVTVRTEAGNYFTDYVTIKVVPDPDAAPETPNP